MILLYYWKKEKWKEKELKKVRLISIPHMIQKNIMFYKRFLFIGLGWPEQPEKKPSLQMII